MSYSDNVAVIQPRFFFWLLRHLAACSMFLVFISAKMYSHLASRLCIEGMSFRHCILSVLFDRLHSLYQNPFNAYKFSMSSGFLSIIWSVWKFCAVQFRIFFFLLLSILFCYCMLLIELLFRYVCVWCGWYCFCFSTVFCVSYCTPKKPTLHINRKPFDRTFCSSYVPIFIIIVMLFPVSI